MDKDTKATRLERTRRHATRAKRLWVRQRTYLATPDERAEYEAHPLGHFRKSSGAGCRGSKKAAACSSKMGSCCKGGFRRTVRQRIAGKRLSAAWTKWVHCGAADDFVEGRLARLRFD